MIKGRFKQTGRSDQGRNNIAPTVARFKTGALREVSPLSYPPPYSYTL
jgi:hypothetical protein